MQNSGEILANPGEILAKSCEFLTKSAEILVTFWKSESNTGSPQQKLHSAFSQAPHAAGRLRHLADLPIFVSSCLSFVFLCTLTRHNYYVFSCLASVSLYLFCCTSYCFQDMTFLYITEGIHTLIHIYIYIYTYIYIYNIHIYVILSLLLLLLLLLLVVVVGRSWGSSATTPRWRRSRRATGTRVCCHSLCISHVISFEQEIPLEGFQAGPRSQGCSPSCARASCSLRGGVDEDLSRSVTR